MARRRFAGGGPALRQGQRRLTEWGAGAVPSVTTNLAANTVLLHQAFTGAQLADVVPMTVVRVRGELWVRSDQVAASRTPFGALGFAVVSEQARAAGVASVPDPTTNALSDLWFVHQFWATDFTFITGAGFQGGSTFSRYSFDSKAMRKVVDGNAIVIVIANSASAGGIDFVMNFRILFKLH